MKVYLFGAGASQLLGLSGARNLLTDIEQKIESERKSRFKNCDLIKKWDRWIEFRDGQRDTALEFLFNVKNPEIILSALDLLALANQDLWASWGDIDHSKLPKDRHTKLAGAAESATKDLKECIEICLHHWCWNVERQSQEKRESFANLFSGIEAGDVVITFNWDWLAEWILARQGLWNPTTGYGLQFVLNSSLNPEGQPIPSPVHVLKLHGSIGWRRTPAPLNGTPGPIRFDRTRILSNIPFHPEGKDQGCIFEPPDAHRIQHYEGDPAIIYPTYLKAVPGDAQLQRIWHQAAVALSRAEKVIIRGYSLPTSDSAARALLNSLAARHQAGQVAIDGLDASATTCQRWNHFLGSPDKQVFKCDTF